MKAFLMFPDRDFDIDTPVVENAQTLADDLGLRALLEAMADGNRLLFDASRTALLTGLHETTEILYRQAILRDCLENPLMVHDLYDTTIEAVTRDHDVFRVSSERNPNAILHASVRRLELYVPLLKKLRDIVDANAERVGSEGFRRLFRMLQTELSHDYLALMQQHVRRLRFTGGILISAELTDGSKGTGYTLRANPRGEQNWVQRLTSRPGRTYTYRLAPRDQAGAEAFDQLRTYGIASVALAANSSADHILDFFHMLRDELAFYLGCLNLADRLNEKDAPTCFPVPVEADEPTLSFSQLYDVCTSLTFGTRMVGNDLEAGDRSLVMITGANQGGKSTFLGSLGTAQLMMQCGLFVGARSFIANIRDGIFTHYKRAEDASLTSGKLDEELARMSELADQLQPTSFVLFNESFAATNEREGSEIARQIVHALLEHGNRVAFVTHHYDLARGFAVQEPENTVSLRAERGADGARPFTLREAPPLPTSFGSDLYRRILGDAPQRVGSAG